MKINLPVTGREQHFPQDQTIVSVTDLKGRITYCNETFIQVSGFTEAELLGQPHNVVRHPDVPAEAFRDLWETIQSGRPWKGLVKNRCKNGDHYWVWANATPVYTDGRIVGYLSVRTCPPREALPAAEALYARLNEEEKSGRRRIGLRHGQVVRVDLAGRIGAALRPGLRGQLLAILLLATAGSAAAAAWGSAAGAVAALAGAGAATWAVLCLTVRPLARFVGSANRLAAGDLTVEVPVESSGHFRELEQALAQLSESLRTVVGDTRAEIENLRGAIQEIAAGNRDLSSRTEAQASSLEQTAASMEQISGTARQSAESAGQGARLSQDMATMAQRSQEAVERVAESMGAIDDSSRRVAEIIHLIEGVAFQTNILALNAAVEAARAGEAGRGFAVVAAEVRALAQRTAEAARDIKRLINESTERVAAGNAQTAAAAERMREAVQSVHQVTALLSQISNAATEQQGGLAQIGEAVTHMDSITQQNAAMVEQLAATATTLEEQVANVTETMRLLRLRAGDRSLAEGDAVELRRAAKRSVAAPGEAFDFSKAIAAHAQWKVTLRNAANGAGKLDAARVGRDDCCPLGEWIHGEGRRRCGQRPAFAALVDCHKRFHAAAGAVAEVVNGGNRADALGMLGNGTPFAKATAAVLETIQALQADMGDARPRAVPALSPARDPALADDGWRSF
jgi:aerotaxis receptor